MSARNFVKYSTTALPSTTTTHSWLALLLQRWEVVVSHCRIWHWDFMDGIGVASTGQANTNFGSLCFGTPPVTFWKTCPVCRSIQHSPRPEPLHNMGHGLSIESDSIRN